ncbi:MAG: glycosyltransferase, partial [Fimbriiglobus sp.]
MKILVLTNLYPPDILGGYELGSRQVVNALLAAGHEVRVLTGNPRNGPVRDEPHVARRMRLVDVYDQYYMERAGPAARAVRHQEGYSVQAHNVHALTEVAAEFQPDVVYVWNVISVGGLGLLAAVQHLGLPWVMHLMDRVPGELCTVFPGHKPVPALVAAFQQLCRGRFICC